MGIFNGKIEFLPSQNGDGFRVFASQSDKLTEVKQILNSLKSILTTSTNQKK